MNLTDLSWPAVETLDRQIPVVIPIAALEQHGRHLPLFTDSFLLGEIVRRSAERLRDRALFAPLLWLGNSDHHLDFPGTLSAAPRAYLELLESLLDNFIRHGFKRLVLLNGHGGNDVPGRQVIFELRQRHRDRNDLLLLLATYWQLGVQPGESIRDLHQAEMGHACEWETSMMLRLAPNLVGPIGQLSPVPFGHGLEPAARGWITKDRSVEGHIGSPHLATAEKGEALFAAFTAATVGLVQRVAEWDGKSWHR